MAGSQDADLGRAVERDAKEEVAQMKEQIRILKKDNLVLKEQVRYWKWRVVGKEDVALGKEYLIEER